MQIVLSEFSSYKPHIYHLTIDGVSYKKHALMVIFANSNQFGFNTKVAPDAKVDDGYLDVCIVKKMPASKLLSVGYHMMRGTLDETGYVEYLKGQHITIEDIKDPLMNIDGEPKIVQTPAKISIKPLSLRVIVP
jgi:diacylglycerol kinase (ATP)